MTYPTKGRHALPTETVRNTRAGAALTRHITITVLADPLQGLGGPLREGLEPGQDFLGPVALGHGEAHDLLAGRKL